jgi:hypothetical protein
MRDKPISSHFELVYKVIYLEISIHIWSYLCPLKSRTESAIRLHSDKSCVSQETCWAVLCAFRHVVILLNCGGCETWPKCTRNQSLSLIRTHTLHGAI